MKWMLLFALVFFIACQKGKHCENATVYKSEKCGVEWELEFMGERYPADSLPVDLQRHKNKIFLESYRFFDDPRLCACCGYRWLIVEKAEDEMICL